ncbi:MULTISPECIES: Qat anti-phage system associated protein QatB [unclassified Methylobacterium]|uniref:Qat anti-phage system associated protein QatB n=1 Tax=unclassified Methylobacterium TaxID=2615210 RepID=UPI000ACF3AAD|nr:MULTISPECIES: Qat anti-phage system associated protein QatB [unclassified Methylobacterium]
MPKRFQEARRGVGAYVSSGDKERLRAGLGSYVGKGYRGGRTASARMGQAATSAGRAYDVLSGLADGSVTQQDLGFDPATVAGAPMDDVIDALVDVICRNDTTLDDAAGREAVNEALSEVLAENPGTDPLAMPVEHTQEVWLRTVAYHVFEDIMLDLGAGLQRGAFGDAKVFNDRRYEIRDFVRESFREQYGQLTAAGRNVDRSNAAAIAKEVTSLVFDVYEGWME